ncbi:MAG TPA: ABC transporter ATP-binding protein [Opitutaceae bacterium]
MSSPPPIVTFQRASKRYGDGLLIIDDLTLTAQPGDFISLIGPSGCGKSTLLKLISGLSTLSSGSLHINGLAPEQAARELAYVFQEPTLLPWLTVGKNVELLMRLDGSTPSERAAIRDRVLSLVRLDGLADRYPRQLSGGQKMRVSIARALSRSPRILLLDEPFGALDEMTRDHLNEELLAIREQEAWTAFFVTHSVAEAVFLSNRIVIMAAGPGRIHEEIRVDFPYPRTAETRQSPAYQQLVARVSRVLRSVEEVCV